MCLGADDAPAAAANEAGSGAGNDVETEQLLSEIELLTSRALQETNQARVWHGNHEILGRCPPKGFIGLSLKETSALLSMWGPVNY